MSLKHLFVCTAIPVLIGISSPYIEAGNQAGSFHRTKNPCSATEIRCPVDFLEKLMQDINTDTTDELTPLQKAVCQNNRNNTLSVYELVFAGADTNVRDAEGCTPLHHAVKNNKPLYVTILLGPDRTDINAQDHKGRTPLHWAVRRNNKWITEALLNRKANIHIKDHKGNTPSSLAQKHRHLEIAKLMEERINKHRPSPLPF